MEELEKITDDSESDADASYETNRPLKRKKSK